jgi:hypothetical protein
MIKSILKVGIDLNRAFLFPSARRLYVNNMVHTCLGSQIIGYRLSKISKKDKDRQKIDE